MTDHQRLGRAYERLMWAYPRWYRKERGTELVTTLLDDASPGQLRPTRADVVDLLRGGLRTRLRLPRGAGPFLVACLVALWMATAGAAAAVFVSPYDGPPAEARAIAVATAALGERPHDVPGPVVHCYMVDCPVSGGQDDVVAVDGPPDSTDHVTVYHQPAGPSASVVVRARDRLAAAGWDVTQVETQSEGVSSFRARSDGLAVSVSGWPAGTSTVPDESVEVVVTKDFSTTAVALLVVGFFCGLLAGWLTAAWVLQRKHRHRLLTRAAITAAALPFLCFAALTVFQTGMITALSGADGFNPKDIQIPQFCLWILPATFPSAGAALAALTLVAVGLAGLPPSARPARRLAMGGGQ